MKDIKTKDIKPKILEKAGNISKDVKSVMKEQILNQKEQLKPEFKDKSYENETDYATGKVETAADRTVYKSVQAAGGVKDYAVRKTKEYANDKKTVKSQNSDVMFKEYQNETQHSVTKERPNAKHPQNTPIKTESTVPKEKEAVYKKQFEKIKIKETAKTEMPIKTKEEYIKLQDKKQINLSETKPQKQTLKSKQATVRMRGNLENSEISTHEKVTDDNKKVPDRKIPECVPEKTDSETIRKIKTKDYVIKKQEQKKAAESSLPNQNIKEETTSNLSEKPQIKTKEAYRLNQSAGESGRIIKTSKRSIKSFDRIETEKNRLNSMQKAVTENNGIKVRISQKKTVTTQNINPSKSRIKTSKKLFKQADKVRLVKNKAATQVRKKAAKKTRQEAAKKTAQAAKITARTVKIIAVKTVKAVAAIAKAVGTAVSQLGGWAILLILLIIIIIVAAIAASPFGIFISEEVNEVGSIPLSQIISEYNIELTQEVEDIELSVEHTDADITDNRTDNNIVLAVFAAKTAGAEDDTAQDVVIFDEAKAEKLKEYFRNANTVEYEIETVEESERLIITVRGKSKDELMDLYGLTLKQREAVETLLEHGDVLTSSSHSLAITNADVQSIINGLPSSLPQKRKDVVKNAGSLVGKVNYFWGGKSSAIGWDSAWGTMRRVTAAGSPTSGTMRSYGLDCSGFVTWVFNNSGMGYDVGHGTYGQRDASVQITASAAQAGDLCFLPSYSHVGIVVGKDTSGNILVIHCSSGANNVVVSTASSVGFTVFRRPNCY